MQTARIIPRHNLASLAVRPTAHTLLKLQPQPNLNLNLNLTLARRIIPTTQNRPSSFLHNDAPSSAPGPSRPPQKNARESWFGRIRRRRERNARPRSKISTLALDHTPHPLSFGADAETKDSQQNNTKEDGNARSQRDQLLTKRRRKVLIWAAILTMPVWGRDVVEAVVPGMLGMIIIVGGGIKRGIGWVKTHIPGRDA